MARSVSIRRSLLTNLLVLVLFLSAALMATTYLGERYVVRELFSAMIGRALERTEAELRAFTRPIVQMLAVTSSWGEVGRLEIGDPDALNDLLVPIMQAIPQISSVMLADERGREHMILRIGDRWRNRQTRPNEWGEEVHWLEWTAAEPEPKFTSERTAYDPRTRPWYRAALLSAGEPSWTAPYTFFTLREPGVTASVAFEAQGGSRTVVGFDVLLSEISAFTTSFEVSENGMVFVLTDDARLLGLPGARLFDGGEGHAPLLQAPSELGIPLLVAASEIVQRHPPEAEGPWRFASGGEAWWLQKRVFSLGNRSLVMAVLVPETDLLGNVTAARVAILGLTVAALGLAILRAMGMANRYSRPIEVLVHESDRISRGDLEPGVPVKSTVTEVSRLAQAHERMRDALRSLFKLERDLRVARQIQQKTFPARMPRLDGYEVDAWSDPADETGGDTYDVIGVRASETRRMFVSAEKADHLVLLLADATGHGIGPALSATQVRAMLRMAIRTGTNLLEIARHMNEQLCADLDGGRFVTVWLGELDTTENTLTSFSAGQAPILHYDAERGEFRELPADTAPFGILPALDIPVIEPIELGRGDVVAVMSDGVFEATDRAGRQFGLERVTEIIRAHRKESASTILAELREGLAKFTAGSPADDDRTAVLVKRSG